MRAIWTGAIGFGLVNIPVKLYSAAQRSELDLDMLDKKDHSNIHCKRVNERTGKEVAWGNMVKGYAAYSVRPVPGASVSAPLLWKEVKHGLSPRDFTIFNVQKRLVKNGDLFQNVLKEKTNLEKCLAALESRERRA